MTSRAALLQGQPKLVAAGRGALCATGWLATCPEAFRERLLKVAIFRRAVAGEEFIHAGDENGGLFGICTGTAELAFRSGHPYARAIHLVHAGFWAGYKTLLGKARFMSVSARTDLVWVLVPHAATEKLLADDPAGWRHILELADRLGETASEALADALRQDSNVRAIAVLLRLAGCRNADPPELAEFDIRLSQSDIAAMAAMSRNTLNGIVSNLVDEGLVELGYRSIRLRNTEALRAIVTADE